MFKRTGYNCAACEVGYIIEYGRECTCTDDEIAKASIENMEKSEERKAVSLLESRGYIFNSKANQVRNKRSARKAKRPDNY
jgi:hypothetical protein